MSNQEAGIWGQLSSAFAQTVSSFEDGIVAVRTAGRSTVSGVVWRDGVIVTVRHALRRGEDVKVIHRDAKKQVLAQWAGSDPGTDLALLRVETGVFKPIQMAIEEGQRVGDIVLSIGRSRLGDISASAGIIARLGGGWRTWSGGKLDRLIRPDVRLYVGMTGSALVDEHGRVLGINNNALARSAVITVPSKTVDRVVSTLLERGSIPRPYLGIAMQAVPLPEGARAHFPEGTERALLIMHLESGAPAAAGGALVGDLIVSFGGDVVRSVSEFQEKLVGLNVGDSVPLVVLRGGNKMTLTLQVGNRE
jgi:S1-C subfamily serine protease